MEWHYVGKSGEPVFENGWSGTAKFTKNSEGLVAVVLAVMKPGVTSGTVFTLPIAYRPGAKIMMTRSALDFYTVESNGQVGVFRADITPFPIPYAYWGGTIKFQVGGTENPQFPPAITVMTTINVDQSPVVVARKSDGTLGMADIEVNEQTEKSSVLGFVTELKDQGEDIFPDEIRHSGSLSGFSELIPNEKIYLYHEGSITQNLDDINPDEWVIELGTATSEDTIDIAIKMGYIGSASSRIQYLKDLADVADIAPQNGQILVYDSIDGKWKPRNPLSIYYRNYWTIDYPVFPAVLGGDDASMWNRDWTAEQKKYAKTHFGYWCDDNGYIDPNDPASYMESVWAEY